MRFPRVQDLERISSVIVHGPLQDRDGSGSAAHRRRDDDEDAVPNAAPAADASPAAPAADGPHDFKTWQANMAVDIKWNDMGYDADQLTSVASEVWPVFVRQLPNFTDSFRILPTATDFNRLLPNFTDRYRFCPTK